MAEPRSDRPIVGLVLATSAGGVGRHVGSLVTGLVARECAVRVCGPQATDDVFGFAKAGADFRPAEIASGMRPLADARAILALRPALRGVDVVHAHGLRAGLLAAIAAPRTTPLVVTWHNAVLATGAARWVYAGLERVVARRADVTLGVSRDLVDRVRALGAPDVRLAEVPAPPLEPPRRSPAAVRDELGAGERPLVLAVGRLHPQKGFDVLVTAATSQALRGCEPLVVIAGDGPERGRLEMQIAATGAPVRLLGRRHDVSDLLAAADVVVMPSVWEGQSLALQETLRAGAPLVATQVGGIPGLAGDAALLVPAGDAAALASALADVLRDPRLRARLAAAGRARASSWPDDDQAVDNLLSLYLELRSR